LFDRDAVPTAVYAKVRSLAEGRAFEPDRLAQMSLALPSIAKWVCSVLEYADALQRLKPFQEERAVKESELGALRATSRGLDAEEVRIRSKLRKAKALMAEAQARRDAAVTEFNAM
jgi:hypothetical protein